jgi:hypothetical protein
VLRSYYVLLRLLLLHDYNKQLQPFALVEAHIDIFGEKDFILLII